MSATPDASTAALNWEQCPPEKPAVPPPPVWKASLTRGDRHIKIKVEPGLSRGYAWWHVDLLCPHEPDNLFLMGYAADLEAGKQEAQAVAELFLSGRPLLLDRRPTRSLPAPPETTPAPSNQDENPATAVQS